MKPTLFYLLLSLLLAGCSKDDPAVPPTDGIDQYTGTTWVRYGFKSPVNGKEVYYYLTFKKNNGVDSYVKYNKTEPVPDQNQSGTYTYGTSPTSGVGFSRIMITIDGVQSAADIQGAKLIYRAKAGDLEYVKE